MVGGEFSGDPPFKMVINVDTHGRAFGLRRLEGNPDTSTCSGFSAGACVHQCWTNRTHTAVD